MDSFDLRQIVAENKWLQEIIYKAGLKLTSDERNTVVFTTSNVFQVENLGFKIKNKREFIIEGLRPLEVAECLLNSDTYNALKKITEMATQQGYVVEDIYPRINRKTPEGRFRRMVGPVKVIMHPHKLDLFFPRVGVRSYFQTLRNDTSFECMFVDLESYFIQEQISEENREKNRDFISLIEHLFDILKDKNMLEPAIKLRKLKYYNVYKMGIESAHFFRFGTEVYSLERESLGKLIVSMIEYLNTHENANIQTPS